MHNSPLPAAESKEQQGKQVSCQQQQVKVAIQEEPLGQEAPIHRPLEYELAAEIKGLAHVTNWVF